MSKYVCSICGYIYDEAVGQPGEGIAPGTAWELLPETWLCPVCGASREDFYLMEEESQDERTSADKTIPHSGALPLDSFPTMALETTGTMWSNGALSVIFSNLAKGSEKQVLPTISERFAILADYYSSIPASAKETSSGEEHSFTQLQNELAEDLATGYAGASAVASVLPDRGALRSLVWGEKVTKMQTAILSRFEKQQDEMLRNTNLYVCEICGFLYTGDEPPEICPVCKVPSMKIRKVG